MSVFAPLFRVNYFCQPTTIKSVGTSATEKS